MCLLIFCSAPHSLFLPVFSSEDLESLLFFLSYKNVKKKFFFLPFVSLSFQERAVACVWNTGSRGVQTSLVSRREASARTLFSWGTEEFPEKGKCIFPIFILFFASFSCIYFPFGKKESHIMSCGRLKWPGVVMLPTPHQELGFYVFSSWTWEGPVMAWPREYGGRLSVSVTEPKQLPLPVSWNTHSVLQAVVQEVRLPCSMWRKPKLYGERKEPYGAQSSSHVARVPWGGI